MCWLEQLTFVVPDHACLQSEVAAVKDGLAGVALEAAIAFPYARVEYVVECM